MDNLLAILASTIVSLSIIFGVWYFLSLEELPTAVYIDIGTIGGGYVKPKLGFMPSFMINDKDSVNYDPRYDDYDVIPLKQIEDNDGNRIYVWDYPGYEDWKEGDQNDLPDGTPGRPKPTFKRVREDDRPWLERKFDYVFIGLKPFYKVLVRKVPQHKVVPYISVLKKFTQKEEDRDDYPEWSVRWKDHNCIHAVIALTQDRKHHPLFWDEVIVSKELETGVSDKDHEKVSHPDEHEAEHSNEDTRDDLIQLDIVSEGQLQISNPYDVYTKAPSSVDSADAAMQAGMRVYMAHRNIDEFQRENHLSDKQPEGYLQTVEGLNGKYVVDDHGHYVLTEGLRKNSGIKFTKKMYLTAWSASNKQSELMVRARQEVFIKRQALAGAILDGKAAGAKVKYELEGKQEAEVNYKTAMANLPLPKVLEKAYASLENFKNGRVFSFGKKNPFGQVMDITNKYLTEDDTQAAQEQHHHGSHEHGHEDHAHGGNEEHGHHDDPHHPPHNGNEGHNDSHSGDHPEEHHTD